MEHKTRAINNGFLKEGASAEARMNDVKGAEAWVAKSLTKSMALVGNAHSGKSS